MADAGASLVEARLEQLLREVDPAAAPVAELRGRQYDLGLAWVHFPEGDGGLGLRPAHQRTVDDRLRSAGAPPPDPQLFIGLTLAGPTIATHGSERLKAARLRALFTGEERWCQLFSEPGAGSDLAGLATRATSDGDEWVVTGQKVWSTLAHIADRALLVARTDPDAPKHHGLSYFALDMRAPGVEVRPLRQMTGSSEFNEVFLSDVRVPDHDRIGAVGEGWRVVMTTLANERSTIGVEDAPARGAGAVAEATRIWSDEAVGRDGATRDRLLQTWVMAEVQRLTNVRAGQSRLAANPGPEGSIAKLAFGEVNMAIYELCVDLLGPQALVGYDYTMHQADSISFIGPLRSSRRMFLRSRANSIEGGTSEIQRNILGERVLGLPSDPRVDHDMPWSRRPRA